MTYHPVGEYVEIPGIINGDFNEGNEGWYTQGKTGGYEGAKQFYQRYGGTYTTQEIIIEENQGIAFMLKSNGARLEALIDGYVIYYGDYSEGTDWIRIVVPFGNTYLGPRDLYFIICDGEDDGAYIALDNITMVEFTGPWVARARNTSDANPLDDLNITIIHDYTQSIEFNISAGTERTWEFLIPEYGIIWEAKISFSGEYVSMSHAWRRGGDRFFVGSTGRSLIYTGSEDIVFYVRQDYLWGTITVDYYLADGDPNKIWVMAMIMTNLPTVSRGGDAYIDIA